MFALIKNHHQSSRRLYSKFLKLLTFFFVITFFFIVHSTVYATTQWKTLIVDNFDTDTVGQLPTNWTEKDSGYFDISSSQAFSGTLSLRQKTVDAANSHIIYRTDSSNLTDVKVEGTFRFTTSGLAVGLVSRLDPSTGFSYMGYLNNNNDTLQIYRVGSSIVKLTDIAVPISDNTWYTMTFEALGSTLTATLFNSAGVQLATVSTTDTTYTTGYVGIRSFVPTASQTNYIDSFRAYTRGEVTATKLQTLLPGEILDPGSASGKSLSPQNIYTGVGYNVTVNAVDSNWNVDVDSTATVNISSNDPYTILPNNAALSSGTKKFAINESLSGTNRFLTASDISSTLTSSTSALFTVQGSYPFLVEPFVDQTRLENLSNISLNTNAGTKYSGNPVISHGISGKPDSAIVGYNTIWKIGSTYYVWYSCNDGTIYQICYATSSDGVTWVKPSLGLISYGGNTNNNVIISGSGVDAYGGGVWYDPDDTDPSKRYKMLYDLSTFTPKLATSPDGINWTTSGSSPWLNTANHEPRGLLKVNNRWYAYAQHFQTDDREIVLYTNDGDFLTGTWVLQGTVLSTSSPDNQKYGFSAWYKDGVFYGIDEDFNKTTDNSKLDLWVSRDGINWTQKGNLIPNGTYDSGFMVKSNMFTDFGDTWRLYYGGSQRLHSNPAASAPMDLDYSEWSKEGVTDVQLTDTNTVGNLRTVVIPVSQINSKNLTLNSQSTSGTIKVEVLDSSNNIISGFSANDSNVISGNSTSTIVTWGGSPSLSRFTQDSIKLKFYLTGDAKLYSYEFIADTTTPTPTSQPLSNSSNSSSSGGGGVSNPNSHSGWSYTIQAGPNYIGTTNWISGMDNASSALTFIPSDSTHDDVYTKINAASTNDLINNNVIFPWQQDFNAVSEIYNYQAFSAFNGYILPQFDAPVTIVLPYDPTKLYGISPTQLKIAYYDATTGFWKTLTTPMVVDQQKHTISTTVTKFTYFAVVYFKNSPRGKVANTVLGAATSIPQTTIQQAPKNTPAPQAASRTVTTATPHNTSHVTAAPKKSCVFFVCW